MDRPTCETCLYWEKKDLISVNGYDLSNLGDGLCHRYPGSPELLLTFRPTKSYDYCGENPQFPAWIKSQQAMENCLHEWVTYNFHNEPSFDKCEKCGAYR